MNARVARSKEINTEMKMTFSTLEAQKRDDKIA